jgi:hypothetical protein
MEPISAIALSLALGAGAEAGMQWSASSSRTLMRR